MFLDNFDSSVFRDNGESWPRQLQSAGNPPSYGVVAAHGFRACVEHFQDTFDILKGHVDASVRHRASTNFRLRDNGLPLPEYGADERAISPHLLREVDAFAVVNDELSLGSLVEVELFDGRSILSIPRALCSVDRVVGDTIMVVLLDQKIIGSLTDQQLDVRKHLRLFVKRQGGAAPFRRNCKSKLNIRLWRACEKACLAL